MKTISIKCLYIRSNTFTPLSHNIVSQHKVWSYSNHLFFFAAYIKKYIIHITHNAKWKQVHIKFKWPVI